VYRIVLMNGGAAEYEAVLKEYLSTEDNQVCCWNARTVLCSLLPPIPDLPPFSPGLLPHSPQIRKYPMFTLGATRDRALKQRTLDWAVKSGQVKMQDTFYPLGSVTGSVEGANMAWLYFQEVRVRGL
jgi:hypothetical protein